MTSIRGRLVAAGVAAVGAVAGGVAAGVSVHHRRRAVAGGVHEPLAMLPPHTLGPVTAVDGTPLEVRAAGSDDAPTLVFIHGFSLDMTTWHYQWIGLDGLRCVLYDLRGHGRSGRSDDLGLQAMGLDVGSVLDVVTGDRPVVLVGHSMGAMAILSAARAGVLRDRVAGAVLIGAASSGLLRNATGSVTGALRPRPATLASAARRVDRLRRVVLAGPTDIVGTFTRLTQFGPDAPKDLVDHIVRLAGRASSEVWTDGLTSLMEMDLRHTISALTVPTLVVVGQEDRVTPPGAAIELAGELPDGRLAVIPDAGHHPMLERPQDVNEHLRAFAAEMLPAADPEATKRKRGKA